MDRFNADIEYIMRSEEGNLIKLCCSNFFVEKFDDNDRKNIINAQTSKESIIDDLKIMSCGMESKWDNVLKGEINWIEDYKKTEWYSLLAVNSEEKACLEEIII